MVKKVKDGKSTIYFCEGCGIHTYVSIDLGIPELGRASALEDLKGIKLSLDHEKICINKVLGYDLSDVL